MNCGWSIVAASDRQSGRRMLQLLRNAELRVAYWAGRKAGRRETGKTHRLVFRRPRWGPSDEV